MGWRAYGPQRSPKTAQSAADTQLEQGPVDCGVAGTEDLVGEGGEKMEVAHEFETIALQAAEDSLGDGAAQVKNAGDQMAEGDQLRFAGRPHFVAILGTDADAVQHPAAPSLQTTVEVRPCPCRSRWHRGVQETATRHVGAPNENMVLVEGLQELPQAVADGGQGAAGDWDAAGREIGGDFPVPARLLVALRLGLGDQVLAETLAP